MPEARLQALAQLREPRRWDLVVVGGGATGLGVALDAAVRGLQVLLLEATDFAQGTSSRATKLVHGGVRYLAQGHLGLVREALRERSAILSNAPHLAQPLAFVVPGYRLWELPFYGAGLKAYEWLAGQRSLGPTQVLSARATREALPTVLERGLLGGIRYWDGQFDDARLAVALARTAAAHGAVVVNHLRVTGLRLEGARVRGVHARDAETGEVFEIAAGCVVNATGVWVDGLRRAAAFPTAAEGTGGDAGQQTGQETGQETGREMGQETAPLVTPSQGVHLVVDRAFLPGSTALMVPKTTDGRVLFAVPWLGKTLLGTTDTPRSDIVAEPRPFAHEVDFILREAARYLSRPPMCARPGWVCARWFALPPRPPPKAGRLPRRAACRASTRWRWAPPGWSPSRVASGPPTGPWPRTCWRPAWRRVCCPSARAASPSACRWWARPRGARCASPRASTCTAARPRSCGPCRVLIAGWPGTRRAARAC